jgi:Secretion system C-terminal sorting domain
MESATLNRSLFIAVFCLITAIPTAFINAQTCTTNASGAWGAGIFTCTGGSTLATATQIIINHPVTIDGVTITLNQSVNIMINSTLTISKVGANEGVLNLTNNTSSLTIASGGTLISGGGGSNNVVQIGSMIYNGTNFASYSAIAPVTLGANGLPVTLIDFDGVAIKNAVKLYFNTASEVNNKGFEIERSTDGLYFEKIGYVEGAVNSRTQQDYIFTDEHPVAGNSYYRLRQIDLDGADTYSKSISVVFGKPVQVSLSPSPVRDQLVVRLEEEKEDDGTWQIFDASGRLVLNGNIGANTTTFELDAASLVFGTYILRIQTGNETEVKRFLKN